MTTYSDSRELTAELANGTFEGQLVGDMLVGTYLGNDGKTHEVIVGHGFIIVDDVLQGN